MGDNTLTAGTNCAGIQTLHGTSLTINGSGRLTVKGGIDGAGIGGSSFSASGSITIDGGVITAIGGENGAGIGCDKYGLVGSITINGGVITATGGNNGAGIGGGYKGAGANLSINSGVVTATGGDFAAGIGGGYTGDGGHLYISGCVVTANGGVFGAGVGGGYESNAAGTLTMTGTAISSPILFASSVGDKNEGNRTNGLLFIGEKTDGIFYGSSVSVSENVTIHKGFSLFVPTGKVLTILTGRTLTNNGTVYNCGTINRGGVFGAWVGNEPVSCEGSKNVDVINGRVTNGIRFAASETVNITANKPPQGFLFTNWTAVPSVAFASADSPSTTFKMPTGVELVTVTANFGIDVYNPVISAHNPLKAWVRNGLLHVTGLTVSEPLSVYSAIGIMVYHNIVTATETDIPLKAQGLYFVRSGVSSVKVLFE